MLIDAARSSLLMVDIQERLAPVMHDPRSVLYNGALLVKAARRLEVPVLCSEQYPKGLGPTMVDVREVLPEGATLEKSEFSCAANPGLLQALRDTGREQVVVAGIEAHVCVLQTCLGLTREGFEVFVVRDACSSRREANAEAAFARMAANGVSVVTLEMALFEWLGRAGTDAFKEITGWIK